MSVVLISADSPTFKSSAIVESPAPANQQSAEAYEIQQNTDMRLALMADLLNLTKNALNRPAEDFALKLRSVDVHPMHGSRLMVFSVTAFDPTFAADFANTWATQYVSYMKANSRDEFRIVQQAVASDAPLVNRKAQAISRRGAVGVSLGLLSAIILATFLFWITKDEEGRT